MIAIDGGKRYRCRWKRGPLRTTTFANRRNGEGERRTRFACEENQRVASVGCTSPNLQSKPPSSCRGADASPGPVPWTRPAFQTVTAACGTRSWTERGKRRACKDQERMNRRMETSRADRKQCRRCRSVVELVQNICTSLHTSRTSTRRAILCDHKDLRNDKAGRVYETCGDRRAIGAEDPVGKGNRPPSLFQLSRRDPFSLGLEFLGSGAPLSSRVHRGRP